MVKMLHVSISEPDDVPVWKFNIKPRQELRRSWLLAANFGPRVPFSVIFFQGLTPLRQAHAGKSCCERRRLKNLAFCACNNAAEISGNARAHIFENALISEKLV